MISDHAKLCALKGMIDQYIETRKIIMSGEFKPGDTTRLSVINYINIEKFIAQNKEKDNEKDND